MTFDPATIPDAWPISGDFTLPDWDAIGEWVDKEFQESQFDAAYSILCRYWMEQLRAQLGGEYHVVESKNFYLLTAQSAALAQAALRTLEYTRTEILREWKGVASDAGYGPHMAIMFDEVDDYYDYIGQYYPNVESQFAGSSGMMLNRGYSHIAIADSDLRMCASTLFHEMTHVLVAHLPLPLWINEGLATSSERVLSGNREPLLDERLAKKHHWYWNEHNIQEFWSGEGFSKTGQSQRLSYNLAEILANHMRDLPGFRDFVLNATWEDAGEAAAQKYLGGSVGDIAAIFLGDGFWDVNWDDAEDKDS